MIFLLFWFILLFGFCVYLFECFFAGFATIWCLFIVIVFFLIWLCLLVVCLSCFVELLLIDFGFGCWLFCFLLGLCLLCLIWLVLFLYMYVCLVKLSVVDVDWLLLWVVGVYCRFGSAAFGFTFLVCLFCFCCYVVLDGWRCLLVFARYELGTSTFGGC